MDLRASSLMSFLPWAVMALGSSLSGVLSDALVARGAAPTAVRKAVQTAAFLGPVAPLLALAAGGLTPAQGVACMTLALGATSVGQFVTNMGEVAPRHAGRLFGLCNTFGSMAGILGVSGERAACHALSS
jgi:ACS family sodium-dependent inorganic phosphate cotransporter/ACS family sodium-dependent inorganic phosphate cotransporter-like MFS transporter 9